MRFSLLSRASIVHLVTLAVLLVLAATPASAQRRNPTVRRGAPGAPVTPTAEATIALGSARYSGSVDATCTRDERARAGTARAYYHILYPRFGTRPAPGQPEWRLELNVPRSTGSGALDRFMFHFGDGARQGTIQNIPSSERMGSGTVRITPNGAGARFEVEGRSQKGETIRATIECSSFPRTEGAGG